LNKPVPVPVSVKKNYKNRTGTSDDALFAFSISFALKLTDIVFALRGAAAQEFPAELVGEEEAKVSRHLAGEGGCEAPEQARHPLLPQDV